MLAEPIGCHDIRAWPIPRRRFSWARYYHPGRQRFIREDPIELAGDVNLYGYVGNSPVNLIDWSANRYTEVDLILPDGGRIHYVRISPGTGVTGAIFENTAAPTPFYKSRIAGNASIGGWDLTLKDGTVYHFPANASLQYIQDRYGNRITITRAGGNPRSNITQVTSPNGRWIQFTYDASNRITQAQDHVGRVVTYIYDASGRLATVTDPHGGITQYTYDAAHRMLTLTDARGLLFLTNEYDANGRVTKQTQADATTFQFVYTLDGNGKVTQADVTDPRGTVRRATFNSDGYTVSDTRALGLAEQQGLSYQRQTGSNFILSTSDALSRQTAYTYDTLGNMTGVTRVAGTADAVTTTLTYEPTFSQVTSVTDPLGHTTTLGRDSLGNLTSITNVLNQQTTVTYNAAGQPLTIADFPGTTSLAYDFGDLSSVTDPLGHTTTRFTDSAGRLTGVANPLGRQTRYDYDVLNRLAQVTDPRGGVTGFGYDTNGNLLSVTDARGSATGYSYDAMDRLATRTDPVQRAEGYGYDANGNLTSFTDRKHQGTVTTYDALNRPSTVTYAGGSTTAYTWDAGNRLSQVADSLSGTITRTYDLLDRLTQETTPQGTVSYTYDAAGRRTSMTVGGQSPVTYGYDNADRLTQITQGSAVVGFSYDAAGRRATLTLPSGIVTAYAYDAASHLTGLTYKLGATVLGALTYTYDAAGNRTSAGGTWARTGLPQPVASASYNAANQQLAFGAQTLTYDANGNLTSDGSNTYTWNARNQLVVINGASVNASFSYDGLGRRRSKSINGTSTQFLYDGLNPVQEIGVSPATLLTGLGIDEYLTRTDATGTRTPLTDALGSTVALTDAAGAVQSEYTYEPFGAATEAGTDANPFQYTGRENDGTGLYYYRARYYHPGLQRFVSEDPIGFRGGDTNLYAYVLNSPTGFRDTRGLIRESTIQAPRPSASPPPPPPTYPFPIGTVVLVGQGSAIGGPGGVVGSFAFAFNVELCQDGLNIRPGILLTGGTGAGLGVGAGGFLGYIEGPPENALGPFVNFNGGVPAGGLTTVGGTVYTSITGHILGGAGQFGVGVPPVSGTITVEYTTGYFFGSPCRSQSKSSQ